MDGAKGKELLGKVQEEKLSSVTDSGFRLRRKLVDRIKVKKTVGSPPRFDTPEQMIELIDAYFENNKEKIMFDDSGNVQLDKHGNPIIVGGRPLSIAGLCYALGFAHRQSLNDYLKKPEFSYIIRRARLYIEAATVEACFKRDTSQGARFILSAVHGYVAVKETSHSGSVEVKHSATDNLSEDEKRNLLERAQKSLAIQTFETVEMLTIEADELNVADCDGMDLD